MISVLSQDGTHCSSIKLRNQQRSAYAVGNPDIKHSDIQNVKVFIFQIASLLPEIENLVIANTPCPVSTQITSWLNHVPGSTGEDSWILVWVTVIGYMGVIGNSTCKPATAECSMAEGCLKVLERSHVKTIYVWTTQTRVITYCLGSSDLR